MYHGIFGSEWYFEVAQFVFLTCNAVLSQEPVAFIGLFSITS